LISTIIDDYIDWILIQNILFPFQTYGYFEEKSTGC
jgi:hypothetical protein